MSVRSGVRGKDPVTLRKKANAVVCSMSRGGVPPSASPTTMTSFVGPVTVLTVQQTADSNERLTKELSDSTTNAGGSATVVTPVNGSAPSDPNPRHHPIMTSSSSQIPRSISLSSLPTPLPKGEREYLGRVERRKLEDGRFEEWNPIKTDSPWETPKEEHMPFELGKVLESERTGRWSKLARPPNVQPDEPPAERRRAHSLPPMPKRQSSKDKEIRTTAPKWGRLRSLLPTAIGQSHSQTSRAGSNPLGPHSVNINDELIAGGLATLMLKLWFERDEKGHRRVPILLHRLRIRISDSLHPFNGNRAVFRIECEYANGTVRWVIYRQLRDFLSLHTHYAFSNAYNRNIDALPDFPKTSEKITPSAGVVSLTHFLRFTVPQILKKGGEGERQYNRACRIHTDATGSSRKLPSWTRPCSGI